MSSSTSPAEKPKVLVITGSVGVGKSSTADVIAQSLKQSGTPHAVIDIDYLRHVYPRPEDDPYHRVLAAKNLASVWKNDNATGINTVIIPNVFEDKSDIDSIKAAIPESSVFVVRLRASIENVHKRLHERSRRFDDTLEWELSRSAELVSQLESSNIADLVVDTDNKSIAEVSEEILSNWLKA